MDDLRKKTVFGLFWRFAERTGAELVSFVVSIVLARLLVPEDYGLIALVSVFIAITSVFVDSGFGIALIQKKDADQLDFSSVFYFNIVTCLILYLLLFFAAPWIADFYEKPQLVSVVRVLSLTLIISGVKNVQSAYVSRNMLFKRFFFATLGGTIGAAVLGITMAYLGFGVWALVVQQLFNNLVDTVVLWITVKWRPTLQFSFKRIKKLLSFGWKLLASGLLHTVYTNLRSLIIGKVYSSADLAYYNKGSSFPSLVVTNINSSINSVLLPVMSSAQDSKESVKNMTRRAISVSSFIMWPMMIGLAIIAKPLIVILLTDKWLMAVPFLQIAAITYALEPLQTANLNAINAMGRSEIYFKLEIMKKTIALIILLASVKYGVIAIALSCLGYSFIALIFNSHPNRKLLGYSFFEQLKDILPSVSLSLLMGACIYPLSFVLQNQYLLLLCQVVLGIVLYIMFSALFKCEAFLYCKNLVQPALSKFVQKNKR